MNIQCIFLLSVLEITDLILIFKLLSTFLIVTNLLQKQNKKKAIQKQSLMKSHDSFKKAAKNHKICYINRRFGCLVSVDKSTRVCVVR